MKIKLSITRHTTESELIHLGNFFTALGLNRGASVCGGIAAPTDPAELEDPEVVFVHPDQAHDLRTGEVGTIDTGIVPPKRRRRTKAEIEAAAAAEQVGNEQVASTGTEAAATSETAAAPATDAEQVPVGNADPAPTPPAPPPATPPSETASTEPASASPSEPTGPITHADAQKQAIDAARRFGPEKVKAIIAEYEGAAKIADLKEADLASFIGKLQALAA